MLSRSKILLITALMISITACDALGGTATPALQGAVVPTRISTATPTLTPTNTATATELPTETPTNTPEASFTPTNTPTSTDTLTPTNTATLTPSPTPETPIIQLGVESHSVQSGEITEALAQTIFTFEAVTSDLVSVRVIGQNGFDPAIILQGVDATILSENDNVASGTTDAVINNFLIPANGIYTVTVTSGQSGNVGAFELVFDNVRGAIIDPSSGIIIYPIPPNTELRGMIDNNRPFQAYVFLARAGTTISIDMNRIQGDLDPYLVLVNRQTQEIMIESDDTGPTLDAQIIDFTIAQPGQYIILATRYQGVDGTTNGEYTLRVNIRN